jgi:hypothetical protein
VTWDLPRPGAAEHHESKPDCEAQNKTPEEKTAEEIGMPSFSGIE